MTILQAGPKLSAHLDDLCAILGTACGQPQNSVVRRNIVQDNQVDGLLLGPKGEFALAICMVKYQQLVDEPLTRGVCLEQDALCRKTCS